MKNTLKNKLNLKFISLILIVVSCLVVSALVISQKQDNNHVKAKIGNETYSLTVLDTQESRTSGLSGKSSLPERQGMLFDFKQEANWRIWMKNMKFPIDIAWLNSSKEIIYIKHNAKPEDYPEKYSANMPSLYVVEVPANTFNKTGVSIGDKIEFN